MSEKTQFEAYKKKLQGICDENDLVFRFRGDRYPITLTIRPVSGVSEQLSLLANDDDSTFTSPNASLMFAYIDGYLTYKMSEKFAISDAMFGKIKNLYKNMHNTWLGFFYRDVLENHRVPEKSLPKISEDEEAVPDTGDWPEEDTEDMQPADDGGGTEDSEQEQAPEPEEEIQEGDKPHELIDLKAEKEDPDVQSAIKIVRDAESASIALIQRSMKIGYSRASHIISVLEALGVVGPYNGSSPRTVLPYDKDGDVAGYEYEGAELDGGGDEEPAK